MIRLILWSLSIALGLAGWIAIVAVNSWAAGALAAAGLLGILTLGNSIVHGRWRPW